MAVTVGIRELRENLRAFLERAESGEEVVVTARGKPIARITPFVRKNTLERLIEEGRVQPALRARTPIDRSKLARIREKPTVADILIEQRR